MTTTIPLYRVFKDLSGARCVTCRRCGLTPEAHDEDEAEECARWVADQTGKTPTLEVPT